MTPAAEPKPAPADPTAMPPRTTPTWEMELLLSGATVFALVQLVGVLDQRYYQAFPALDAALGTLWMLLYLYARSAVLILAAAFAVHLCLRAHWVALVGLRSVFPAGVRMDRLRGGPLSRALAAEKARDIGESIERADNRATLVFGIGVALAMSIVAPSVLVVLLFGVAWLAHLLPGQQDRLVDFFLALTLLALLPMMLAASIDALAGERLRADGAMARAVRAVLAAYHRVGMSQNANTLYAMYSTNFGTYRTTVMVLALMFAAFGATMWSFYRHIEPGAMGAPDFWPERINAGTRAIHGDHYADQRRADSPLGVLPNIPSLQVGGAWLPLTIPLRPRVHADALEECPAPARAEVDAETDPAASAAQRAALLDCVAAMHALTIDGQPVAGVTWDLLDRPAERIRGVLAMVPIAALAPGRHELVVARPQDAERRQAGLPRRDFHIPFWKVVPEPRD